MSERDRLAKEFTDYYVTMSNQPVHRPDVLQHAFKEGFDAGENSQRVRELVSALEEAAEYADTDDVNGIAGYIAQKALSQFTKSQVMASKTSEDAASKQASASALLAFRLQETKKRLAWLIRFAMEKKILTTPRGAELLGTNSAEFTSEMERLLKDYSIEQSIREDVRRRGEYKHHSRFCFRHVVEGVELHGAGDPPTEEPRVVLTTRLDLYDPYKLKDLLTTYYSDGTVKEELVPSAVVIKPPTNIGDD